jgi:2-polyprenyl-6-methoxyphenol hydroxylase-like FAD-dependent oxidoreductase
MTANRYDVVVVGAGPSGLTTAIAATRAGARVLLVDRRSGTSIFPKATGLRPRTMELMRAWGLETRIRACSQDLEVAGAIHAVLTGPVLQEFPLAAAAPDVLAELSPTTYAIAPQDHVEPVLLTHLRELGGEVRFGVRVHDLVQHDDGVRVHATAEDRDECIDARWVVGADGGDSTVRRLAGLDVRVLGDEGCHLSTLFRADLARHLRGARYALHMVVAGDEFRVFVPSGTDGRWMFDRELHPERGDHVADWTEERAVTAIREAAGVPDLEIEVIASFPWSFAASAATAIQAGRVFLVGDAAHRTTPRGATGMNTGIADGHNLGWKLGWVARGLAGEPLLATYAEERYTVGLHNALASLEAFAPDRGTDLSHDFGVVYESAGIQPVSADPVTEDGAVVVAAPGARAPHAWVSYSGERRSTVDLFEGRLTLLAGPHGEAWRDVVATLPDLPVEVLVAGRDVLDPTGDLERRYRLGDGGAVLVRPDGHLAWRLAADDAHVLDEAISSTLGHQPVATV